MGTLQYIGRILQYLGRQLLKKKMMDCQYTAGYEHNVMGTVAQLVTRRLRVQSPINSCQRLKKNGTNFSFASIGIVKVELAICTLYWSAHYHISFKSHLNSFAPKGRKMPKHADKLLFIPCHMISDRVLWFHVGVCVSFRLPGRLSVCSFFLFCFFG